MIDPHSHGPLEGHRRYRDNSPDALFGAILAIEAVLGTILSQQVMQAEPPLAALRRQVEAVLAAGQATTKYGTGGEAIADGAHDCLDAIATTASRTLADSAAAAAVNTP